MNKGFEAYVRVGWKYAQTLADNLKLSSYLLPNVPPLISKEYPCTRTTWKRRSKTTGKTCKTYELDS